MNRVGVFASVVLGMLACGCVERELDVRSNPPGALVYMNDQEVGRTPVQKRFVWYGYYDVQVRKEGYQPLKTTTPVIAPWWQWLPFDFVAELLPFHFKDTHTVSYTLAATPHTEVNPEDIVERGEMLRGDLESSRAPKAATRTTTRP
ncbi:MAG TPA: PEGA domain-containing protein [Tepidisphaeraceae bacterium]|nr:PEGA domain-containing protein [Tepidisphaeraceae bacterium]